MGRPRKLAVGAALGAIPFLASQAPAAAAVAEDTHTDFAVFTHVSGDRYPCTLDGHHEVDTGTGGLDVTFRAIGCTGTLEVTVRYVDQDGDAMTTAASAHGDSVSVALHKVGRTAVTVDYDIVIDACTDTCTHTLQTSTK
jgi:hypothetical protein